ncbi:hypothetical protein VPHD69_0278 [Vibrio phage D69]
MFDISVSVEWQYFSNQETDLITPIEDAEYISMDVRIVPDWNTSVYIEWDHPDIPDVAESDLKYVVYYSESEYGPFTSLHAQPIHGPDILNTEKGQLDPPGPDGDLSFFTTWQVQDSKVYEQYFTIEVHAPEDDFGNPSKIYRSYPKSPSQGLTKWHRLRQRDIMRREAILLDKFVGVETIVRTKKRRGKRCTSCWDPIHLKVTDDHCEACLGTSYEGGYDTGMRTKLQYSSIDPQSRQSYQGREENITISAWGIAYPLLHPGSIILRVPDRKIFRVEGHQGSTEMLTTVQRQNIVLTELGRDSIENALFNRDDVKDIPMRVPHTHH